MYSSILGLRPPNQTYFGSRSPQELLKASGLTQVPAPAHLSLFHVSPSQVEKGRVEWGCPLDVDVGMDMDTDMGPGMVMDMG